MGKNLASRKREIMQITTPTPVEIPVTPYDALGVVAQHWHQELALIQGAPVLSIATVLILAALAYFINRLFFQSTVSGLRAHIGQLDARIEFQAEKLKDAERQAGALAIEVPIDLKAQVVHLEESLQRLQADSAKRIPRRIANDQWARFSEVARGRVLNQIVFFHCNVNDPECESFAEQLVQMFRDSGWSAGFSQIEEDLPSDEGLLLVVADPAHLIPDAVKVSKALLDAGFAYKIVRNPGRVGPTWEQFYLLVGSEPR